MEQLVRVAACNLNQWALDFDLNLANVVESIRIAKEAGCTFRTGPELELSGYGCQDHFLEMDTIMHCWESLAALLKGDLTDGILCDVGMPLLHRSTRYNCRVFLLNRKIVGIRPKLHLANEGNYRERRWFTAWTRMFELDEFWLPSTVAEVTGQQTVPFGIFIVRANDTSLASETCEELWAPESPNIIESLNGAEIIANGSGSHHNLRKLAKRLDLIRSATVRNGGVYLYSNQQGCDGDRLYYDGSSMICLNGQILQQASQFSVNDIEVLTATIDLQQVRSFRAYVSSRSQQSAGARSLPEIKIDFNMTKRGGAPPTVPREPSLHTPEEEIAYGPSCWLWDYMRRSGASGFFLPLSGGADSSSTATLVGIMCRQVVDAVAAGNERVLADARRVAGEAADSDYAPTDPREFANRIMHTCYMGTENSSVETRARARRLAEEIGTYHMDTDIDKLVSSMLWVFEKATGKRPRFRSNGGSNAENLAMQNIQARLRMVLSYLLAQLLPWVRGRGGFLLVLGSANVDEALRGYMTKYDCSSADINPIGGIAKADLRRFLAWSAEHMGYTSLLEIVEAPPTAELEPITAEYTQSDEVDMGMTYAELGIFGRLRKMYQCGPVSMFERLKHTWSHIAPTEVASKVKKFFKYYSINRHKLTTLTPAYHAEEYSPDDNRYDLRQFLYNTKWPRQFRLVDALAELAESSPAQEPENPAFVVSANL